VPISALRGDNVVTPSERAPWYQGPTLMNLLENIEVSRDHGLNAFRLPVQYVNRPNLNFRGFCGTIVAGEIHPGDEIVALPSGKKSRVKAIVTADGDLPRAFAGQAITLTLETEIDVSRGDMIVRADEIQPHVAQAFDAHIVWMNEAPLTVGKEYAFKLGGKQVFGRVQEILHRIDVNTMAQSDTPQLALNEIGLCRIAVNAPTAFDAYTACRGTGGLIIIDRLSNATAGAGMIAAATDTAPHLQSDELARLREFEVELNALVRKYFPHWDAKPVLK